MDIVYQKTKTLFNALEWMNKNHVTEKDKHDFWAMCDRFDDWASKINNAHMISGYWEDLRNGRDS